MQPPDFVQQAHERCHHNRRHQEPASQRLMRELGHPAGDAYANMRAFYEALPWRAAAGLRYYAVRGQNTLVFCMPPQLLLAGLPRQPGRQRVQAIAAAGWPAQLKPCAIGGWQIVTDDYRLGDALRRLDIEWYRHGNGGRDCYIATELAPADFWRCQQLLEQQLAGALLTPPNPQSAQELLDALVTLAGQIHAPCAWL